MMDGDLTAAANAQLGTAFHAPQVRLVTEAGAAISIGGQPVVPDIISATVTLSHTETGIVDIVMNNQRHGADGRPVVPPWRYNKMETLSIGSRVRVDMRYGADGWTPMILARITNMTFAFPSDSGSQITLKGEDLTSLLKTKPETDEMYIDFHEIDIVERALGSSGTGLSLPVTRPQPAFAAPLDGITHEKAKSYLEFFKAFAERMDYEIFAEFDDIEPGQAGAQVTAPDRRSVSFHFEPARSGVLDALVSLHWGRDIIEFKPAFKAWDILTGARASGSVPRGRGTFEVAVPMSEAINDLHASPGSARATPLNVASIREGIFADETRPAVNEAAVQAVNIDQERARLQAVAKLRSSAREFLTAEMKTVGFTRLRPGIHVDLTGLYAPFDGIYYVTRTIHSLTAAGYLTTSTLRRPGMLDPATYPDGGAREP
jgi:hypothetical protein